MAYLRIVPLGGLGEIGMNCLALESPEGVLVVDCGITFPHEEHGVDVIHPLFDYLEERAHDLLGVVVTHGHEDHIGALPYLLRKIPCPVWAPPYAMQLIRERLREFPEVPEVDLIPTTPRKRFKVGKFEIEPLRVTHSIPDSTALAIQTAAGMIVHTGDFKLEDDPIDGEATDRDRFEELGAEGVSLLLSDSTNVDVPGMAGRERTVAEALLRVVGSKRNRVIVGMFPSNVHRLQTLVQVAMATNRRICLLGRSVQAHVRAATELGKLGIRGDMLVSADRVREVPRHNILVLASGTQGEGQSSLARLSAGDHPRLTVEAGDAVVLSSRAIPGNERSVWDMVCAFERRGLDVHFYATDHDLHVSGHACREEQRRMIDWVQPRGFVPIHGSYHHLARHAALAHQAGVRRVEVIENGQTLILDEKGISEGTGVRVGRVYVDAGSEVPTDVLRERAVIAEVGLVCVTVPIHRGGGLHGPVTVAARGVVSDLGGTAADDEARKAVEAAVRDLRPGGGSGGSSSIEAVREAARRAVRKVYGKGQHKPMIVVTLQEG